MWVCACDQKYLKALGAPGITAEIADSMPRQDGQRAQNPDETNKQFLIHFSGRLCIIYFGKFMPDIRNIACCVRFLLCS